jgi:hypothetical protein
MTDQLIPSDLLHRAKVINGLRPVAPFGWDVHRPVPVLRQRLLIHAPPSDGPDPNHTNG